MKDGREPAGFHAPSVAGLFFSDAGEPRAPRIATPAPSLMTASAALAQLLLNRFQPFSESAIQGARFSWRDSSFGDLGQDSALERGDLV